MQIEQSKPRDLFGKSSWFIWRKATPEEEHLLHSYVGQDDSLYLHSDGVWRGSTQSEFGKFTGYYATREEAVAVLARVKDGF